MGTLHIQEVVNCMLSQASLPDRGSTWNQAINIQEIRVASELQETMGRQYVTMAANLSFESL